MCVLIQHLSGREQGLIDLFLQLSIIIQLSLLQRFQPSLFLVHRASQQRVRVHVRQRRRVQVTVLIWVLHTKTFITLTWPRLAIFPIFAQAFAYSNSPLTQPGSVLLYRNSLWRHVIIRVVAVVVIIAIIITLYVQRWHGAQRVRDHCERGHTTKRQNALSNLSYYRENVTLYESPLAGFEPTNFWLPAQSTYTMK